MSLDQGMLLGMHENSCGTHLSALEGSRRKITLECREPEYP